MHSAIENFGHGWPSVKNQGEPFETLRGGPTTWNATEVVRGWFGRWTRGSGFVGDVEAEAFGEEVRGWKYEG